MSAASDAEDALLAAFQEYRSEYESAYYYANLREKREYYASHLMRFREYYAANRKAKIAYQIAYRKANLEVIRAKERTRGAKNREANNERARARYAAKKAALSTN